MSTPARNFVNKWYPGVDIPNNAIYEYVDDVAVCVLRTLDNNEHQIIAMVVHPLHRMRGVGTRLLNTIVAKYGSCAIHAFIIVDSNIADLLRFYRNAGFIPTETVMKPGEPLSFGMVRRPTNNI